MGLIPPNGESVRGLRGRLCALFNDKNFAEMINAAEELLPKDNVWMTIYPCLWLILTGYPKNPPGKFSEEVPQDGLNRGKYKLMDAQFWTCGFFPGSLYCLLE